MTKIACNNNNCQSEQHKHDITVWYDNLVSFVGNITSSIVSVNHKKYNKPGWNDFVKSHYNNYREAYKR